MKWTISFSFVGYCCGLASVPFSERIDAGIAKAWNGLDGKTATSPRDVDLVSEDPFVATYGEVAPSGARVLFDAMSLGPGANFADLGSGVGRLAAQAYVERNVDRCLAVEFWESRHARAVEAWSRFCREEDNAPLLREDFDIDDVQFVCANVLDVSLEGVTHAFVSNYCFDELTNDAIAHRLLELPSCSVVASSRPLPELSPEADKRILVDMSWSPRVVVSLYFLH